MAALINVCALTLWNISLKSVDIRGMTDLGLASVLPAGCFIALGGLTLSFCLALLGARERSHPLALTLYPLALIFMLYATPTLVEQSPRFQVTYWLVGHTEYILRNGSVNPFLDAYFNWPGFFVLTGLLTSVIGAPSALALAQWASFVYNLLYLAPMYLIYSTATRDRRLIWLGLWLFYITDWVWQDYFSPQGLNLFLYLVIMAILLKWFKTTQAAPRNGAAWTTWRSWLIAAQTHPLVWTSVLKRVQARARALTSLGIAGVSRRIWTRARALVASATHPRETLKHLTSRLHHLALRLRQWLALSDAPLAPEQRQLRIALLVAVLAVFAFSIASHPMTPLFALLSVSVLVLFRQITPRWLPILMALMIIGWDFTVASPYMAGHLSNDLAKFGNIRVAATANVSDRLAVGSAAHQFIAQIRIVVTTAIWGLALLGAALRWRPGARWYANDSSWGIGSLFAHDLKYAILAVVPYFMIAAQPYGGEMAMRSYLISLPVISFFAAAALCTPITGKAITGKAITGKAARLSAVASPVVTMATCTLLLTGFMFARYGNERADYITYNETNAVAFLYSVAPPKSLLLQAWTGTPWRYQDLEQYEYAPMYTNAAALEAHDITGIVGIASKAQYPAAYVIITRSQEAQAEMFDSVPPSTFDAVEQALLASGKFVLVYSNTDASVLMYVRPQHLGIAPNRHFSSTPTYKRI